MYDKVICKETYIESAVVKSRWKYSTEEKSKNKFDLTIGIQQLNDFI